MYKHVKGGLWGKAQTPGSESYTEVYTAENPEVVLLKVEGGETPKTPCLEEGQRATSSPR